MAPVPNHSRARAEIAVVRRRHLGYHQAAPAVRRCETGRRSPAVQQRPDIDRAVLENGELETMSFFVGQSEGDFSQKPMEFDDELKAVQLATAKVELKSKSTSKARNLEKRIY